MKNIFFSASIYYLSDMLVTYEEIIKYIKNSKSNVMVDWVEEWRKVHKENTKSSTLIQKKKTIYNMIEPDKFFNNTREILNSDAVIAEVSHPTVGVGYQLFYATLNNKPVLALFDGKKGDEKKIRLIININSPLIILRKYNKESLHNIIFNFINKSNQKLSKFNFVITEEVKDYIDWLSNENQNVSRSVLLRETISNKIIFDDMEYQKYLKTKK